MCPPYLATPTATILLDYTHDRHTCSYIVTYLKFTPFLYLIPYDCELILSIHNFTDNIL